MLRYKTERAKQLENKLASAAERKEGIQLEKAVHKVKKNLDFFKKCLKVGEKNFKNNIDLFETYKYERHKSTEVWLCEYIFLLIEH